MTVQTVPYALQNASHSAALFRQSASAPFTSGGILAAGELTVTQQATPNMSIILGAGRAKVAGTSVSPPSGLSFTTQGMYDVLNDAPLTVTVATADATNPRIDVPYLQVQDSFYSGAANQAIAGIVTGTPAPTPVTPPVPSNAIGLNPIAVGANVTSIVSANIGASPSLAVITNAATPSSVASAMGLTRIIPTSAVNGTVGANGVVTFSGSAEIGINGCFTTAFDNYLIEVVITSITSTQPLQANLRLSGSDVGGTAYDYATEFSNSTTPGGSAASGIAAWNLTPSAASTIMHHRVEVISPALAQPTLMIAAGTLANTSAAVPAQNTSAGVMRTATAHDGIAFKAASGNISGVIRVYGYNNN